MAENMSGPVTTRMTLYPNQEGGFAVWLPDDWHKRELNPEHLGMLFSPYEDDINTCFLIEKRKLEVEVTKEDVDILREGFKEGLKGLPGIEVLSVDENSLGNDAAV